MVITKCLPGLGKLFWESSLLWIHTNVHFPTNVTIITRTLCDRHKDFFTVSTSVQNAWNTLTITWRGRSTSLFWPKQVCAAWQNMVFGVLNLEQGTYMGNSWQINMWFLCSGNIYSTIYVFVTFFHSIKANIFDLIYIWHLCNNAKQLSWSASTCHRLKTFSC